MCFIFIRVKRFETEVNLAIIFLFESWGIFEGVIKSIFEVKKVLDMIVFV